MGQIMFRFVSLFFILSVTLVSPAQAEMRQYELAQFDSILVNDAIDVSVRQGPAHSVIIETDYDEFDQLIIEVKKGELQIARRDVASATTVSIFNGFNSTVLRPQTHLSTEVETSTHIDIQKGVAGLDAVKINGSSVTALVDNRNSNPSNIVVRRGLFGTTIKINDRPRPKVSVTITMPKITSLTSLAGSSMIVESIITDELKLRADAIGKLKVSGTCNSLQLSARDSSIINARHLRCENIVAHGEHNARVKVNGFGTVDVKASHKGHVKVYGEPKHLRKSKSHRGVITTASR